MTEDRWPHVRNAIKITADRWRDYQDQEAADDLNWVIAEVERLRRYLEEDDSIIDELRCRGAKLEERLRES